MPPFNATGGDLVDQVREWIERQRERLNGRANGAGQRPTPRKAGRRPAGRLQAVPLGSAQARATAPPRNGGRGSRPPRRSDRAERSTYTLILAGVLLILVIALFYALSWALGGSSTPSPAASATTAPTLQQPAAQSSPPPFAPSPSPSPSPDAASQVPGAPGGSQQGRIHVVEGGDTLNRISQRYGVTVEAIMQANGFTERNRILRIGERLVIPDPGASPAGAPAGSPIPR